MPPGAEPTIARVRLARVARHERWFAERYLHAAERAAAALLAIDKRRVDFVAGRVAAKRALGERASIEIGVEEGLRSGAPVALRDGRPCAGGVSISHGAGWAVAAAIGAGRIGVDVERIESRHRAFEDEAFARGELDRWRRALPGFTAPAIVTVAWCAKEAVLKWHGIGLRGELPAHDLGEIAWRSTAPSAAAPFGLPHLAWATIGLSHPVPQRLRLGLWLDASTAIAVVCEQATVDETADLA